MHYVDARERAVQLLALMESQNRDPVAQAKKRGRDLHRHVQLKDGDRKKAFEALHLIHRIELSEMPEAMQNDLREEHQAELEGFLEGFRAQERQQDKNTGGCSCGFFSCPDCTPPLDSEA